MCYTDPGSSYTDPGSSSAWLANSLRLVCRSTEAACLLMYFLTVSESFMHAERRGHGGPRAGPAGPP